MSSVMQMPTVEKGLVEDQSANVTMDGKETGKNANVCIYPVLILY